MDKVKEEMDEQTLTEPDNSLNMDMVCDIKVETEESADEDLNGLASCAHSNLNKEIKIEEEDSEIIVDRIKEEPNDGTIKMEVEDDQKVDNAWFDKSIIKEEALHSDTEGNSSKDGNEFSDTADLSSVNTSILKGLLIENNMNKESANETGVLSNSEHDKSLEEQNVAEESKAVEKFRVNMSAIESVSKENQASELQVLDGLSVYDQAALEAGILRQVDQALEDESGAPDRLESAMLLEPEEEETEMERQIRLGEMTPFGSTLKTATAGLKQKSGLSEIEKYLLKQAEYEKTKKQTVAKSNKNKERKDSPGNNEVRVIETDKEKPPLKKKALTEDRKRKKKKKKKVEVVGTETEDFVPWSVRPGRVVGERSYMDPDEASGSEYVPSDNSDYQPSSDGEVVVKRKETQKKKVAVGKKRKSAQGAKPYKIPEDWATDDSDWEYSDEEGNLKTNRRSKKELDDGDVDAFNRRIRLWEREQEQRGEGEKGPKYHQVDGDYKLPREMWDKLYNYQRVGVRWLWELDQQRCGGILGDEMGLGKTIQVICFLAGLKLSDLRDFDTNYRGLGPTLIVCPTTVMHQWVREFHTWYPPLRVAILHESGTFSGKQRSRLIGNMVHAGGVLITSYTGATQHKDEMLARNWHYVILDEGHKIRNPDAQITLAVKQLRTTHRIILSGSPMQNNLKELWSLFDFVFPGKLGTLPVFLEQFAVPITQGGYANASQVQVITAFKCATMLKDTIAPYLLRRMKADVQSHICLPEKNEQVLFCRLTDEQRQLYRGYVESGEVCRILEGRLKIFMGLINLRKICNHPDLYSGGTKLLPGDKEEDLAEEEKYGYWGKSGKMIVVETLLQIWKKQGHRVLIFTQSRQMLAIMEAFVQQKGYSYLKLDGNTSIAARQPLINKFNQNTSYFVMLLTTRVGGLGVNLTGANRVLIYDPDWNPATDTQARERAWRIGQTQSVTVYRLITAGTIEEKMYHRQIFKQFLCNKVLKDPRQRRFFKTNDLFELFTLKETDQEGSTETSAIFAGTGSEVLLDPTKTYKHRKVEPKLIAERPTETYSRKREEKKRKIEETRKESLKKSKPVNFTDEKIERMKKLAQMLSQKIVSTKSPEKKDGTRKQLEESTVVKTEPVEDVVLISDEDTAQASGPTVDVSRPSTSKANHPTSVSDKARKKKRKHKDRKNRHRKDAKFEGETVPYLVKTGVGEVKNGDENGDDEKNYATQDEYVLQKLFSRSGLQTAMKHDTIMEGGPADYALVEGEAERVAKQAVEKLKESRQECWRATSGVPSFTGINGARNFQPKKKFGSGKSSVEGLSSKELLEQIRKRNLITKAKDSDIELVDDIRHFVSSFGGTVNTNQLIARFEGRLAEGSSPLFKSLLSKICTFYRAPDKLGYWTLKQEFNW